MNFFRVSQCTLALALSVACAACTMHAPRRHAAAAAPARPAEPAVAATPATTPPIEAATPQAEAVPKVEPAAPAVETPPPTISAAPAAPAKTAPTPAAPAKPALLAKPSVHPEPAKPAAPAKPATAEPAATGVQQISGQVELVAAPGQQIAAGESANTVVYYVPATGAPKPKPGRYSVVTRNKRFDPELLVVPAGSTVAFPNQDEILHNVFSVTPGAVFDLGLYGEGQSAETVLNKATLVQVFCNVHHSMHTDVLVLSTPWSARAGANGAFKLDGLPAGTGTLYFWHPRAGSTSREITLPRDAAITEKLLATKPAIPEHTRKGGESYRPTRP